MNETTKVLRGVACARTLGIVVAVVTAGCSAATGEDVTSSASEVSSRIAGVTFKTAIGGTFVGAQNDGGGAVNATATVAREWETFTLLDVNGGALASGDEVFIQAGSGQYFQAADGGGGALNAASSNQLGWETFRVVREAGSGAVHPGDVVGLEAVTKGTWVSAQNGGGGPVFAYGPAFGSWERLYIDFPGGAEAEVEAEAGVEVEAEAGVEVEAEVEAAARPGPGISPRASPPLTSRRGTTRTS